MAGYALILSCEHGGNEIPPNYQSLFKDHQKVLNSHRGWDPGTLDIAKELANRLQLPLVYCTISRLLIEMNRSLGHPALFSEYSAPLNKHERELLIKTIYLPYRTKIEKIIRSNIAADLVCLHFSIHSFTPILNGNVRDVDIGILYDPQHPLEVSIANEFQAFLQHIMPDMQVKMNVPYQGIDDGLTTNLRKQYTIYQYAGIEIEINQKWLGSPNFNRMINALIQALNTFKKRKPAVN